LLGFFLGRITPDRRASAEKRNAPPRAARNDKARVAAGFESSAANARALLLNMVAGARYCPRKRVYFT
jgi:hypothetical protein